MFRRFTTHAPTGVPPVDDLVAGALPDRVQIAHERLAHQDDPALLEALSERELAASRELAELVRDYERHEKRARIQAAADAAERVRRTAAELAEREAADLLRAAQAIGEQRHSSSPHAKVARLHQRKPRVLGLLAGVVAFSMLFSAVTVQQNIAPTGGATNPMFWLSYGLEALISAVLVALMLSTGDTAEWGVIDRLWQVYTVEGVLLTASIALNTFPYFRTGDMAGIGIHAIAPIMIGVALVTHRLVAERYGRAIEQATAAVPDHEDLQERLAALTQVGGAGNQILPSILMEPAAPARRADEPAATEPPAPAQQGADVAGQAAAQDDNSAAVAGQPAGAAIAMSVPAPELTELWLATTPLPVIERPSEPGAQPAAGDNADEAVLDARLAAAVRQTLYRIRFSKQPEPGEQPVPGTPVSAPESDAPEVAEASAEHGAREAAEALPEANGADQVMAHGADGPQVTGPELAAAPHEPDVRTLEPIDAGMAQHYVPGTGGDERPARMQQVAPVGAAGMSPIGHEPDDADATTPRAAAQPQLTVR
ncbi:MULTISPECIES: hypothetical protein [Nocardia]|uniref:DUF2637 domain-containing protein n=1 Tax=Nocardia sputorum TaxID=2984338 RepID=A0ABM8CRY3_9NOCA|nr:hypothetical protein [Nocardia sputorum]BDT97728.1 hypothetical protein IFM12276_07570 [Nocardia sputorum]